MMFVVANEKTFSFVFALLVSDYNGCLGFFCYYFKNTFKMFLYMVVFCLQFVFNFVPGITYSARWDSLSLLPWLFLDLYFTWSLEALSSITLAMRTGGRNSPQCCSL